MKNELAESVLANPGERPARICWHVISSEYPPQIGGVSDYTRSVAVGLAECGDEVHVWCPACSGAQPHNEPVAVHRQCGTFSPADLERLGAELDRFPSPRRILVQWVPHGYGYRSMNLGFCWWLWNRSRKHRDRVELMVHEPSLSFTRASLKQNMAAVMHRLMTAVLLRAADQVWMSIPGWERRLRPYSFGRRVPMQWLPIFSNVPDRHDPARAHEIRRRYSGPSGSVIIGHFGTFGPLVTDLLEPILLSLASQPEGQIFLLMGQKSEQFREQLIKAEPRLASLVFATGELPAEELSHHLSACDLLMQPYPDGVTSRRTSYMAGMAHAKPAVTTTGEWTEPLWSRHPDAVSLAPAGDTAAFVAHVRRLSRDAGERLRAGAAARELYQERFESSHIIAALRQTGGTLDPRCAF